MAGVRGGSADAVVVGGGAVGVACAYELGRRGARVTLLEREAEVGLGCSSGNAGLLGSGLALPLASPQALREGLHSLFDAEAPFHLRPSPSLLSWLLEFALACRGSRHARSVAALAPLGEESFRMHLEYQRQLDLGTVSKGAMLTWEREPAFEAGVRELLAGGGRLTVLGAEAARRAEPALHPGVAGAAVLEDVAHTESGTWTRALARAAAGCGADIRTGITVEKLSTGAGGLQGVETSAGTFRGGAFVLAAGVWSGGLLRPLGARLPMQAGKGYHVDLDPAGSRPGLPVYMQEAHVVATPFPDRLRLAGTLDLTGLDTSIDQRRTGAILRAAGRNLTGLAGRPIIDLWAGLRPCTSDGLPVLGASSRCRNLFLATGHAMIGLALAPASGRAVAELVTGERRSFELDAFSPDRF
jgi:D-amino-acid dehydrogenase